MPDLFDPFDATEGRVALTGGTVTLLVGHEEQRYVIHEAPLRARSAFFEAALGRGWKEQAERFIRLPEEDPDKFHVYVQWIHCGTIVAVPEAKSTMSLLLRLYTMGSRLQDVDFQDAVIDALVLTCERTKMVPGEWAAKIVYGNTRAGDPARRLLVDYWVEESKPDWFRYERVDDLAEFSFDMAKAFAAVNNGDMSKPKVTKENRMCRYHHHRNGECYRSRSVKRGVGW